MHKVVQLTRELQRTTIVNDATPPDQMIGLLRQVIVCLADEVVHLTRELETVRTVASRAERQSRIAPATIVAGVSRRRS